MVSSLCDPRNAPAGDVGTAMFFIDSKLRSVLDDAGGPGAEERELTERFLRSFDAKSVDEVLDGACTLIYLFTQWLGQAHEAGGRDVIEHVVPYVVDTLQNMPRSIRPESIPTMAGLVVASAVGQSPTLWRRQYGAWTPQETTALEVTAFLLARYINEVTEDENTATRMIMEVLSSAENDPDEP